MTLFEEKRKFEDDVLELLKKHGFVSDGVDVIYASIEVRRDGMPYIRLELEKGGI